MSYLRNHHTMMKNQNTKMRNIIYQSQRHPWRADILFILRKVPDNIPDVSEKASFFQEAFSFCMYVMNLNHVAYHLTELNSWVPHFIADGSRDLNRVQIRTSWHRSGPEAIVRTSLSNFTFALRPSRCSSFCPSKSSAKRCPLGW